ncbi:hypothetical protein AVEN_243875-1 [Araneus ventricosus]|uniref:Uncharacterized protein n=1 Tax=Araneus ventricosus TaxID=182803 RepID=A0A4Y2KJ75_ARAVE|nr:hypothetical protein AVEN_243875-1 [Araneus ventricosus]
MKSVNGQFIRSIPRRAYSTAILTNYTFGGMWYRPMGYPSVNHQWPTSPDSSVSHRWYTPPDGPFKCEPLVAHGTRCPRDRHPLTEDKIVANAFAMDLMHVTSHPPTRDLPEAAIGQS